MSRLDIYLKQHGKHKTLTGLEYHPYRSTTKVNRQFVVQVLGKGKPIRKYLCLG